MTMTCLALAFAGFVGPDDPKPPVAPRYSDVINEVQGLTTIISLTSEGQRVRKGDVIGELDSATLKDTLINQAIHEERAIERSAIGVKALEAAEIGVKEAAATYEAWLKTSDGEIALAKVDLERAKDRVIWSTQMQGKAMVSKATAIADELTLERAKFDLEQAETSRKVLVEYTGPRRKLEAEVTLRKARLDDLEFRERVLAEGTKKLSLERQIIKCTLVSPADGILRYANTEGKRPTIEEGATVRERQILLRIEAN